LCFVLLQGIASFIELATSAGICIANSEKILRNAKTEDFDKIVERLVQKANARGVIMFVDEDNTRFVLKVYNYLNGKTLIKSARVMQ
jgi:hypothetical protein